MAACTCKPDSPEPLFPDAQPVPGSIRDADLWSNVEALPTAAFFTNVGILEAKCLV